jgi:hypothetical protein
VSPDVHPTNPPENLGARLITIYEWFEAGARAEAMDALHDLIKEVTS